VKANTNCVYLEDPTKSVQSKQLPAELATLDQMQAQAL